MPVARDRSLDPHSYLLILPEVVSSSRVLQVACDVLIWSFLGELHEARDLRLKAVEQYGRLLSGVRHILANTLRYNTQKDTVLASLLVLARIETYISFAKPHEDDGMKDARVHLVGAVTYFNTNSEEILRTRLGREMSSALCSFSRLNGFAQRRASILCQYPDLRNSEEPRDWAGLTLDTITLRIPSLLESTDKVLSHCNTVDSAVLVCQLWSSKSTLKCWLSTHYGNGETPGYRMANLSEAKVFSRDCNENAFGEIFVFDSPQIWAHYNVVWAAQLTIDMALLDLLQYNNHLVDMLPQGELSSADLRRSIANDAYVAAENISRAHPYSNEPHQITTSPIGPDVERLMLVVFSKYKRQDAQDFVISSTENISSCKATTVPNPLQDAQALNGLASRAVDVRVRERGCQYAGWVRHMNEYTS
jgi:hypothetical protein